MNRAFNLNQRRKFLIQETHRKFIKKDNLRENPRRNAKIALQNLQNEKEVNEQIFKKNKT